MPRTHALQRLLHSGRRQHGIRSAVTGRCSPGSKAAAALVLCGFGTLLGACSETTGETAAPTDPATATTQGRDRTVVAAAAFSAPDPQTGAGPQLTYASQWGPAAGSPLPLLAANDQTGRARSLGDLSGANGLLLFFNRSADW